MVQNVDSPAPKWVGAPAEPEITPEMIEAGERCLNELLDAALTSPEAVVLYIPGEWAEAAYRAMYRMRNRQQLADGPKS
jgi:hypothetical protein